MKWYKSWSRKWPQELSLGTQTLFTLLVMGFLGGPGEVFLLRISLLPPGLVSNLYSPALVSLVLGLQVCTAVSAYDAF